MTAGQFALSILPALIVAILTVYLSRWVSKNDKWRDETEKKIQEHDKQLVRLDTSIAYVNAHIEKMREDVTQTRQLVERLWGVVGGNPGVFDGFRKD